MTGDDLYFDMDGRPISVHEWSELLGDITRRRVARDVIEGVEVSTVLVGLQLSWGEVPPLIFETMTFAHIEELDGWRRRWPTRELAEHGHELVCEEIREIMRIRAE